MRGHLAFIASFMLPLAGSAAEWLPLGYDGRGNAWHLDRQSVTRADDQVTAWKRIEFRREHPLLGDGPLVKVAHLQDVTDCSQRQIGIRTIRLLDSGGELVKAYDNGEGEVQWPASGHTLLVENAMTLLCSDAWRSSN